MSVAGPDVFQSAEYIGLSTTLTRWLNAAVQKLKLHCYCVCLSSFTYQSNNVVFYPGSFLKLTTFNRQRNVASTSFHAAWNFYSSFVYVFCSYRSSAGWVDIGVAGFIGILLAMRRQTYRKPFMELWLWSQLQRTTIQHLISDCI